MDVTIKKEIMREFYIRLHSEDFKARCNYLSPYSNRFNRNRLTHSLEVAQIARVIAKNIGLQDTLTVQSCSLAHDIGHPPFGHSGEETLNKLGQDVRFEGNAQTFRILNHLEEKHYDYNGLNLTLRTLLGTVKYFQNHAMDEHKFLYDEDYELVKKISTEQHIELKTIDAEIMDIADEIAYAAHDLEDAFYFKWFSIDELLYEFSISDKYKAAYPLFENIVDKARTFAKKAETYQTSEEYLILFKKELTSNIVNELVNNLCAENDKLAYKDDYELLSEGLKKLTYHAVSRSTENKLYELKGKKIITDLYQVYMDKTFNENMKLLPSEYRYDNPTCEQWERSVFDYISGMMDEYAVGKHKEFFGSNALDTIYKQYV